MSLFNGDPKKPKKGKLKFSNRLLQKLVMSQEKKLKKERGDKAALEEFLKDLKAEMKYRGL